jgi:hypothetical protein
MAKRSRLATAVGHIAQRVANRLTEAVGPMGNVDPDEDLYRRITSTNRDITPALLLRSSKLASYLYHRNPIAKRIIDIAVEWCLGEGLTVSSEDEKVDAVLKRFWNHPCNDLEVKGNERFRDLRLYGELLLRVSKTPGMGTVLLEPIDTQYIDAVMWDQHDNPLAVVYRKPLGNVDTPQGAHNTRETLRCIRLDPTKDEIAPAEVDIKALTLPGSPTPEAPLFTEPTGECFYFAVNRPGGTTRGVSDLFALMDFADAADQFVWTMMERARIAAAMVIDVTMTNADDVEIENYVKKVKKQGVTKPGALWAHNETIAIEIKTPDLGAADTETQMRAIMRVILGGAGYPEFMFADASNTNRASATEQGDPVTRRMTALQKHWLSILNIILRYQYQEARKHGESLEELSLESPVPWKIVAPDLSAKDVAKVGSIVGSVITALAEGEANEYISKDTARIAYLQTLKMLGIEADPQEEAEKIAAQPKPDPAELYKKSQAALGKAFGGAVQPLKSDAPTPSSKTEGEPAAA